uniref:RING-type E3 ubiquitin transferase n=1 Tax=Anopheles atroparvus TaxID=41427 RepID=A0AAG5DRI5_ANOAO
MSLFHANAGQAEIIRSAQKDQEYIENIRSALSELLLLLSQRHWFKYNALCKLIAEIIYHHYGILNNLQTLGEEYTGIIQNEIDRSDELLLTVKNTLQKFINLLRIVVPYVRGFHTILFYINGGKYHIAKRLTGADPELVEGESF